MSNPIVGEITALLKSEVSSHSDGNTTAVFTFDLLNNRLDGPSDIDILFLDTLTRKIDIARRVCKKYDAEWKRPIDKEPVSCEVLLGIILCLTLADISHIEEKRGHSLKWLNAAFNAMRIAENTLPVDQGKMEQVSALLNLKFQISLEK